MTDLMARLTAFATVALAIVAVAAVYVTSRPDLAGGTEVVAEFEDAYPLLEGMHVRVDGAVAGTVKEVELGDDGHAHVAMQLHEGTPQPRSDAIATIRQEDITGDSYVSLSVGEDPEPLGEQTIGVDRTMSAPRFDDLLNAFDRPVRQGLELVFVQLGRALEARGENLNAAALELRPAIAAADRAITEVNSQNDALRSLITDAEHVTGQAAERSAELGVLVDALAATVRTTADHGLALDRALDVAPETLGAAHGTLSRLTAMAEATKPLAETLNEAAPDLARAATLLVPFLADAVVILDDVEPTLDLTIGLMTASLPTLRTSPERLFTAPFDLTAGIGGLLDILIGEPDLVRSLFSAKCYGGRRCDSADDVGLGGVAVEGGNQIGYPTNDPERYFVRAVAVPSCESFGIPIRPGCYQDVLDGLGNLAGLLEGYLPLPEGQARRGQPRGDDSGPRPDPAAAESARDAVDEALDDAGESLGQLGLPGLGGGDRGGDPDRPPAAGAVEDLLDFLLGP